MHNAKLATAKCSTISPLMGENTSPQAEDANHP